MTEEWEVIDKYGNLTGEIVKKSDPHAYEKGVYHWGADVWILNSENKLLIQKRSSVKRIEPNVWAMTGGNVMAGEDPKDTLVREAREELNITLDPKELIYFTVVKTGNVLIKTYFMRHDYDISKMKYKDDEVSEVKWATWKEIDDLVKNNEFISARWRYVKDYLKDRIEKGE